MVPQQQMEKLKNLPSPPEPIRQNVENELNWTILSILSKPNMDQHEKAKQYTAEVFLSLVKMGSKEANNLTLSFPVNPDKGGNPSEPLQGAEADPSTEDRGWVVSDVIQSVAPRSKKNATYVLDKMRNSGNVATWNDKGEFIFKGETVNGSHMVDLIKSLTTT